MELGSRDDSTLNKGLYIRDFSNTPNDLLTFTPFNSFKSLSALYSALALNVNPLNWQSDF